MVVIFSIAVFFLFSAMQTSESEGDEKQNVKPIYHNNFDNGDLNGSSRECHDKSCHDCETEKIFFIPSQGKDGMSLCHTLWNCDERAELKVNSVGRPEIGDERWYRFSYYWPENKGNGCLIAQFPTYPTKRSFRNACGGVGSHIRLEDNGDVSFDFQRPTSAADVTCSKYTIGTMTPGVWHTVIVHVKWTQSDDGFLQVWWNGKKQVDIKGEPTFWNDEDKAPYFKVGAYKGDPWKGAEPFIIYTDDIMIFDETASFKDVVNY